MVKIAKELFGKIDSIEVLKYTLVNSNGLEVVLHSFGACIQSLKVPAKNHYSGDLVLGFPTLEGYRGLTGKNPYFGSVIGRVANRIKNGTFQLDGKEYHLAKNNGQNHLHGGLIGFDKVIWDSEQVGNSIEFRYHSKDGEEGYPGNLWAKVTYTLTEANVLQLEYEAKSDAATPVNLTNHSYFNLAGHNAGPEELYNHEVMINASRYTPVDDRLIPTGDIASVEGTIFDLTKPVRLGDVLNNVPGGGYDHNFVIGNEPGSILLVGWFKHPGSGRQLTVYSTQPGTQFYTGNFIPSDGSLRGKDSAVYTRHGAFCCETQNFPDAINQEGFPDSVLRPGQIYKEKTELHLSF